MRMPLCTTALFLWASTSASAETFSGEWVQMNWEGIEAIEGDQCLVVHTSERRYDLTVC